MKAITLALLLAAMAALAPSDTAAHHGKKEEHAQPAVVRGDCAWVRGEKRYKSLATCTKENPHKGACRSTCK